MQTYYDETRRENEHALPDLEVFYMSAPELADAEWVDGDGDAKEPGWYYWTCFPGCLPDSNPVGPFVTEEEALVSARESAGFCPHGKDDETPCEECDGE